MSKGIFSPWSTPVVETPKEKTERLIEESPEGAPRRTVTFDGRAFQIVVGLFSFDKDSRNLSNYAHDALGRAVTAVLKIDNALIDEFKRQSIFLDKANLLDPKVEIKLGSVTLYVKASSFDPKMATLMAFDRIALSLTNVSNNHKNIRTCLADHDIQLARKA